MLTTGEIYNDAGGDYYTRLDPDKQTRRLIAQLERLGHTVTLEAAAYDPSVISISQSRARETRNRCRA